MWPKSPGDRYKWALHWMTAALVLAVLSTALPLAALSAIRPAQGQWLYWHIAGGWLIAVLTLVRLVRYAIVRTILAIRRELHRRSSSQCFSC